jgi:hypothetical protein
MFTKKLNILILGYYNKNNLGDDLFLEIAKSIFVKHNCQYLNMELLDNTNIPYYSKWCDRIVLFGGEILNNYFLDKLLNLIRDKTIPTYAIGVSSDANYDDIFYKTDIFTYIIFRNKSDYNKYLPRYRNRCLYLPDIVFLKEKIVNYYISSNYKRVVGYFLSQTSNTTDYTNLINSINYFRDNNYTVYLMSMCTNNNPNENDNIINNNLLKNLKDTNNIRHYKYNGDVVRLIGIMDLAICFRFHAHVLAITYGIPFVSISNTPKVINLLLDNNLTELSYYGKDLLTGCKYILENRKTIRSKLSNIYLENYKLALEYNSLDYLYYNKTNTPFYISNNNHINTVTTQYNSLKTLDNTFNSKLLIYLLLGLTKSEYEWGLKEKLDKNINLYEDMKWLMDTELKNGLKTLYNKLAKPEMYTDKYTNKIAPLNFYLFSQNDMRGYHRSGWQYVVDYLDGALGTFNPNAIICDLYIDRTFHWDYDINTSLNIIPYTKKWIGFIHHTFDTSFSNYNIPELFKKPNFIKSLETCLAIFVLSNYLANSLKPLLPNNIKVFVLYHPTELHLNISFDIIKFINNPKRRVIQIGAWLRNINAIYELDLGENYLELTKTALIGKDMAGYYIKGNIATLSNTTNIELLDRLNDTDYDNLLSENIVFINLVDVSAANTIIECIARNTPICINRHPAIIEYLGVDYPLFYDNFNMASDLLNNLGIINCAHLYLKELDKTKLDINTFINSFYNNIATCLEL